MNAEKLETVLLSRDEAAFTAWRLRFAESGVGVTLAKDLAALRAALRDRPVAAVLLDEAHAHETAGCAAEEAVKKLAPALAPRVLVVLAEPGDQAGRIVSFLELGAHDVAQKPVKPRILAEQLKALVRVFSRSRRDRKAVSASPGGALTMDFAARRCFVRDGGEGREVRLTRAEFHVLYLLMQKRGAVATYEDFRAALWPDAASPRQILHVLHQLVTNIRRKLAPSPVLLENLRAEGFRLGQR